MIRTIRTSHVAVLSGALLLCVSGCDALNALMKLADCNAGFLTAPEIKALNVSAKDFLAQQVPPVDVPILTDAQAEAAASFLEQNNANCFEEISTLAEQVNQDPGSVQGLAELAAAFDGTESAFDPANASAEDIQNIFGGVFGQYNSSYGQAADEQDGDAEGAGGGPHDDQGEEPGI